MNKLRTHYDNLKVARDAPDAVIRAAYKVLVQKYHPDKNPGDARAARVIQVISQSYETLIDPVRRREHDAWIYARETEIEDAWADQPESAPPPTKRPESPMPPQWRQPDMEGVAANPSHLAALLLWPFKRLRGIFEAAPQLVVLALVLSGIWLWDAITPDKPPPAGPKPYLATAPVVAATPAPPLEPTPPPKPAYIRPMTAPNGSPWPEKAAYVKGYPIDNDKGYSKVTVDNARNDADVFVKLVSMDGPKAYPVRQFYIPAGREFTINKVTAGKYDIRYMDLGNGGLSRSEAFSVDERRTRDGIEFSNFTMSLYKVQDGNMQTYDLAASEF